MTQDEIYKLIEDNGLTLHGDIEHFAALVEEHVRNTMNEEAKAHLEELRKNFNAESAELRLHQWSQEKQA
jgi:glutamate synthase domain-containing protein 3